MSTREPIADGSAATDQHPTVEIDRSQFADRTRYVCPTCGNCNWDRTNNHMWCPACVRLQEMGRDVDPEHYELQDKKLDRTVPYAAVEFVHGER